MVIHARFKVSVLFVFLITAFALLNLVYGGAGGKT